MAKINPFKTLDALKFEGYRTATLYPSGKCIFVLDTGLEGKESDKWTKFLMLLKVLPTTLCGIMPTV